MLKIALTGGIATGKSYVVELLRRHGVPCVDADVLAHGVMVAGTESTAAIAARFGADVLAGDGSVDRRTLAPIVFADEQARRDLEAIVHPAVYRAIEAALRGFEWLGDSPFAVVDVPLLFETSRESAFDRVIVTVCAPEIQRQRLMARGLSNEQAGQRLSAQLPSDDKVARADFVIRTDGTFEETGSQVAAVLEALNPHT